MACGGWPGNLKALQSHGGGTDRPSTRPEGLHAQQWGAFDAELVEGDQVWLVADEKHARHALSGGLVGPFWCAKVGERRPLARIEREERAMHLAARRRDRREPLRAAVVILATRSHLHPEI